MNAFYDRDARPEKLARKTVAIIGYESLKVLSRIALPIKPGGLISNPEKNFLCATLKARSPVCTAARGR